MIKMGFVDSKDHPCLHDQHGRMADPADLHPPVASINEIDQAGFPPAIVGMLDESLHRRFNTAEWWTLFDNAPLFGLPINADFVPIETAGLWRIDNVY